MGDANERGAAAVGAPTLEEQARARFRKLSSKLVAALKPLDAHTKKKPFPMAPDQEEVSCVGCHKSMNAMLKAGERQGDKAPTKCTTCHAKQ